MVTLSLSLSCCSCKQTQNTLHNKQNKMNDDNQETSGGDTTGYFERVIEFDNPKLVILHKSDCDSSLRILQKWDSDESGVVWDASLLLAKYLELQISSDITTLNSYHNQSVIELGSGTGFLGLWLAAMGASVLLTDLPSNLDLIRRNLSLNADLFMANQVQISAFDWLDKSQYKKTCFLNWKPLDQIDWFIISDCLYYKEGIDAIYEFIQWTLVDCSSKAQFLISYEDRDDKIEMVNMFLLLMKENTSLCCRTIPSSSLHPDYQSPDLHLLLITRNQ